MCPMVMVLTPYVLVCTSLCFITTRPLTNYKHQYLKNTFHTAATTGMHTGVLLIANYLNMIGFVHLPINCNLLMLCGRCIHFLSITVYP